MRMQIHLYGKEADLFEEMLKDSKDEMLYEYEWSSIPNNQNGKVFTVESDDAMLFFFLGQEMEQRKIRYIIANYPFEIKNIE